MSEGSVKTECMLVIGAKIWEVKLDWGWWTEKGFNFVIVEKKIFEELSLLFLLQEGPLL